MPENERRPGSGEPRAATENGHADISNIPHPEAANKRDLAGSVWVPDRTFKSEIDGLTGQAEQEYLASWEPPVPFSRANLPQFPTHALPSWHCNWVEAEASATQTPADLPGMLSLAAIASCVQKKIVIRVRDGWVEPVSVFIAVALGSGERKTAVVQDVMAAIEQYERDEAERRKAEVAAAESKYKATKQRIDHLQAKAAKADDPAEAKGLVEQAAQAAAELAGLDVPVLPRLLADDVTPERTASLLATHGGKLAILTAEGDLFDLMTARYGNAPNFGVFLRGHSGDTLRIDRVGRPAEYVPHPALTLGLAVQPDVLRGLAATPSLRGRGLLARFLYAWPVSRVGHRRIDPPPMPSDMAREYAERIRRLLGLPARTDDKGRPAPHGLQLAPDAYRRFADFLSEVEPRLGEGGDLEHIADWGGKLAGAVARIAGLLHLAEHATEDAPWCSVIDDVTISNAITIGRYLIEHAKATFAEMGADPAIEDARHVLDWILRTGQSCLPKQDIWQGTRGRFQRVEPLNKALTLLIERNYLREVPIPRGEKGGRNPASSYDVNPMAGPYNSSNPYNSLADYDSRNCRDSRSGALDSSGVDSEAL